jgi:hypothetical protein
VRLKFAPKSENKNDNHFTPIKGQASALNKLKSKTQLFFGKNHHLKDTDKLMKELAPNEL